MNYSAALDACVRALTSDPRLAAAPDVAWGIVIDGELAAAQNESAPFRIASMTKSFTASTLGGLARGVTSLGKVPLSLDDELCQWLPRLSTRLAGACLRDALQMATGLPTDDPWADRLESMEAEEFQEMIAREPMTNFAPGTAHEYANYGYAMIGAVIEAATGEPFTEVASREILDRFGLASSTFDAPSAGPVGYRIDAAGEYHAQPLTAPGAFSAIGGLVSTVEDISTWMTAMIGAIGSRGGGWERVLRDMQQPSRPYLITRGRDADTGDYIRTEAYGMGLRCQYDTRFGHLAGHSGGYPGFGSLMRWHGSSRCGIVLFGNTTYFPATQIAGAAFDRLLTVLTHGTSDEPLTERVSALPTNRSTAEISETYDVVPPAPFQPSDLARTRAEQVERLIAGADAGIDELADEIFAVNMDLDLPRDEREAHWADILSRVGEPSQTSPVTWLTACRARWTVRGTKGRARTVEMMLNCFGEVQKISLTLTASVPTAAS